MSKEKATIPLSKSYNPSKLSFPVYVSIKLDGMPIKFTLSKDKIVSLKSRQNTDNTSCLPRARELQRAILKTGEHQFVAEMTHRTEKDFKTVSGHVRRGKENDDLIMNIFDYVDSDKSLGFWDRHMKLLELIPYKNWRLWDKINLVEQHVCNSQDEVDDTIILLMRDHPDAEGLVMRSHDDLWVPASRSWGYQKLVIKPTLDLKVRNFYEALTSDTKERKGMIGGMWCHYHDKVIRVPAGKMKHDERELLWLKYRGDYLDETKICEVQYKKDDSYNVPREPVFQHWRPEKTEPSYE
jgi:ATP-dependent DNA ligase